MPKPSKPAKQNTPKPKPPTDTTLTLRIPKGLHKLLTKVAKLEQRSLNQVITRMLQSGLLSMDIVSAYPTSAIPQVFTNPSANKPDKTEPEEEDVWPDLRRGER